MNKILIIISSLLISVQTYTYACDYISFPYPSCVSAKDKFDEAEKVLNELIDANPKYINAINNLANLKKQK